MIFNLLLFLQYVSFMKSPLMHWALVRWRSVRRYGWSLLKLAPIHSDLGDRADQRHERGRCAQRAEPAQHHGRVQQSRTGGTDAVDRQRDARRGRFRRPHAVDGLDSLDHTATCGQPSALRGRRLEVRTGTSPLCVSFTL